MGEEVIEIHGLSRWGFVGHLVLQALDSFHVLGLLFFHCVLVAQLQLGVRHTSLLDLGRDLEVPS